MANRKKDPEPQAEPTPINGASDHDHGLGEFFEQYPQAINVGELTFTEANELKARNKVLLRVNEDVEHLTRTRSLLINEKVAFMRSIGSRFGLGPRDELNINDETGVVTAVGRRRFVQPEEVHVEVTADEPYIGEAVTDDAPAPVN